MQIFGWTDGQGGGGLGCSWSQLAPACSYFTYGPPHVTCFGTSLLCTATRSTVCLQTKESQSRAGAGIGLYEQRKRMEYLSVINTVLRNLRTYLGTNIAGTSSGRHILRICRLSWYDCGWYVRRLMRSLNPPLVIIIVTISNRTWISITKKLSSKRESSVTRH